MERFDFSLPLVKIVGAARDIGIGSSVTEFVQVIIKVDAMIECTDRAHGQGEAKLSERCTDGERQKRAVPGRPERVNETETSGSAV